MKTNSEWTDYRLIGTGDGLKLEDFGGVVLLRPDPQIIWQQPFELKNYKGLCAMYKRIGKMSGQWQKLKKHDESFFINWRNLKFNLKLMGFKHTGVFPEQSVNWAKMIDAITASKREIKVLNLFAYTGGATLACISAGASVCHIDSAKAMCERAKNNLRLSQLDETKARFIVDDCLKFVEREIRRGNKYDAIIMDPPSYGRGAKGEMWRLEDNIDSLVKLTKEIISENPLFYLINSYTKGLQPTIMKNVLDTNFKDIKHHTEAYEVGIEGEDGITLPCGCSAFIKF